MNSQGNSESYNGRPQVSHKTYYEGYDDPVRLGTYKEQIAQVLKFKPISVLEVGIGNKSVYSKLKKSGIKIIGCDYTRDLEPDVIGNVIALPFNDNSFDVVLCAELLEHLPFEKSMKGLKELKRVTKSFIVLTLPQLSFDGQFFMKLKNKPFVFNGQHYWELGSGKCSLKGSKKIFETEKLKLLDCFAFNVFRLHRFEWLTELLYKIYPKSRLLKFNGYPVFFVLQKKGG